MKRNASGPVRVRRRAGTRGLSLVEVLVAAAVVSIALLSHAASTLAGHRLTQSEESRSVALQFVREFLERIRADEDWAGLYARLVAQDAIVEPGSTGGAGVVVTDLPSLRAPTDYYSDCEVPASLGPVQVLVQVPFVLSGTTRVLREDQTAPAFGLPYDLSGDGVVDSLAHGADYLALPIVVTLRWTGPGEVPQTLRVSTWLRGER
jgi:prepilin-type N-terminal cleavage/methylation domain-containing protein